MSPIIHFKRYTLTRMFASLDLRTLTPKRSSYALSSNITLFIAPEKEEPLDHMILTIPYEQTSQRKEVFSSRRNDFRVFQGIPSKVPPFTHEKETMICLQ